MRYTCTLVLLLLAAPALAEDDDFIRGYAAAVLQRDFEIKPEAVSVKNGVVTVRADLSRTRNGTAAAVTSSRCRAR
jgi:hypothetical protein